MKKTPDPILAEIDRSRARPRATAKKKTAEPTPKPVDSGAEPNIEEPPPITSESAPVEEETENDKLPENDRYLNDTEPIAEDTPDQSTMGESNRSFTDWLLRR